MKKNVFILFTILLFLASCNNDSDNIMSKEKISIEFAHLDILKKNKYKVTQNIAEENLLLYLKNLQKNTSSRSECKFSIIADGKLDMSLTSNSRSAILDSVGVYTFIVKEGTSEGFALISDDIRYPYVLAYSPQGSLADTLYNEGLAQYIRLLPIFLNKKISKVTEILGNRDKMSELMNTYKAKYKSRANVIWGDPTTIPPDASDSLLNYPFVPLPEMTTTEQSGDTTFIYKGRLYVYPAGTEGDGTQSFFVPVKWGQGSPYNNNVPFQCGSGKAPVGCVAVAIAQIMAYHKYPPTYNWKLLTSKQRISQTAIEDKERREEVARLMADIGQKVNMKYDCSGSGSNIYNANNAFISYGYKTSGVQDYSEFSTYYSDPHTSFFTPASFNAPFYMRGTNSNGEGHAFVVDGFFESFMVIVIVRDIWIKGAFTTTENVYAVPLSLFNTVVHFHINWGWDGYSDGYYDQVGLDFDNNKKLLKVEL